MSLAFFVIFSIVDAAMGSLHGSIRGPGRERMEGNGPDGWLVLRGVYIGAGRGSTVVEIVDTICEIELPFSRLWFRWRKDGRARARQSTDPFQK